MSLYVLPDSRQKAFYVNLDTLAMSSAKQLHAQTVKVNQQKQFKLSPQEQQFYDIIEPEFTAPQIQSHMSCKERPYNI